MLIESTLPPITLAWVLIETLALLHQSWWTLPKAIDQWQFEEKDSQLIVCYGALPQLAHLALQSLNHFPNIGEALQRTRSLPINSVCFPERNTSKTAFHRIIIGSSWILTKAPNPFMLEKPRLKCFFERSHLLFLPLSLNFLLLILSSPRLFSGSRHYCVWHRRWADSWSVEVSQGGKCKLIFAVNFCLSAVMFVHFLYFF